MKKFFCLLVAILSTTVVGQQASPLVQQNTVVERVDVSGISDARLTPELRADLQRLAGQAYNADTARQLAEGIQIELPEYVAAATPQPGSQPDRIRLMFVVAKIEDNEALKTNINSRYIVDAVEVEGKFKAKISDTLNADLQKMIGQNLDITQAEKLKERIRKENQPADIAVERKLRRGASPQHVKLVYDVHKNENTINFSGSTGFYHSKEGFGGPTIAATLHHLGAGTVTFKTVNDPDALIERNIGGGLGYSASLRDFGLKLEYSSYRAQWKPNTIQADARSAESPGLYRLRDTLSGSAQINVPNRIDISGGVSLAELQMQSPVPGFRKDNALTGSLGAGYGGLKGFEADQKSYRLSWAYSIRAGTGALGSDFVYARHEIDINYTALQSRKLLTRVHAFAGRTSGNAPMFERFSLGNARTLRGWTKYEIAPLGGNRVAYVSAEHTFKFVTPFYDLGSVWNTGQPVVFHQSVGVRIVPPCKGSAHQIPLCWIPITLGFPIRSSHAQPMFTAGF